MSEEKLFLKFGNMSRIGKKPIPIPQGVEVKEENGKIRVKGPKGELDRAVNPEIKVSLQDNQILFSVQKEGKNAKALWGLNRALVANMVRGVSEGFEKKLEIEGVGYKARMEGNNLILEVGFSHPVKIEPPEGITISVEKNIITISGIDREKVGQIAAKIRRVKPPEPYKGKGIRYEGEQIRRKVGKKAAAAEGE